jgi:hypothetical protein
MFYGDDTEMRFDPALQNSMGNLGKVHLLNLLAGLVLKTYSSDGAKNTLSPGDFQTLIGDATPIGIDINAFDPNVDKFADRRFREADFFSLSGNGDNLLDIDEITYYASTILSLTATMKRVRQDVEVRCSVGSLDGMGWMFMDPACFRSVFFANSSKYWDHEPMLVQEYSQLDAPGKADFQSSLEKSARLKGLTNDPIGGYDASGFILVMLLQENLFARFDADHDGYLNTDEALQAIQPTRRFTSTKANIGLDQGDLLDAIQTFPLSKGRIPTTDIGGMLEVGAWLLTRPFWDIHAGRPMTYKTSCVFSDFDGPVAGCN